MLLVYYWSVIRVLLECYECVTGVIPMYGQSVDGVNLKYLVRI